jgi:hypothetical protein
MTYEKAVKALVDAGLLDKADADAAVTSLTASSVELTYPAWAQALAQAGLIDEANREAAASVMEKAGIAEAKDDPEAFRESLEDAGIL